MKPEIVAEYGNDDVAKVYVARMRETGKGEPGRYYVEFVESVQPPLPREKKWVLIVSSMFGCPVRCMMCDAGGGFAGRLTAEEILWQIGYMVKRRFPDAKVPVPKFKIQFARMGEPALNPSVIDVMIRLPKTIDAPGLNVSMSTIAPDTRAAKDFFERLLQVKNELYPGGRFQLQFSIHTTDSAKRDELIPVKKWSFSQIADYGKRFSNPEQGDKRVTLNFAPAVGFPIDPAVIRKHFDPEKFVIKLTPLNPTVRSLEETLSSAIDPLDRSSSDGMVSGFEAEGFEVILSIGELEENRIGSNCGQYIQRAVGAGQRPGRSYELDKYRLTRT